MHSAIIAQTPLKYVSALGKGMGAVCVCVWWGSFTIQTQQRSLVPFALREKTLREAVALFKPTSFTHKS